MGDAASAIGSGTPGGAIPRRYTMPGVRPDPVMGANEELLGYSGRITAQGLNPTGQEH
jgi:hypothetical protein